MEFKRGAELGPYHSLAHVIYCLDRAYIEIVGHKSLMTSANDSRHSTGSLHYKGMGWDFRTRKDNDLKHDFYPLSDLSLIKDKASCYLGSLYDVVLESDHLHVEYDPR